MILDRTQSTPRFATPTPRWRATLGGRKTREVVRRDEEQLRTLRPNIAMTFMMSPHIHSPTPVHRSEGRKANPDMTKRRHLIQALVQEGGFIWTTRTFQALGAVLRDGKSWDAPQSSWDGERVQGVQMLPFGSKFFRVFSLVWPVVPWVPVQRSQCAHQ